ncbi:AGAP010848-PA [Anopheles gambiae str. PEST]|uniref:AGAP010848-PA n=1 Tax=Anopheles gambiae TaxID=7165 RepID=Q7QGP9_ANOGA|nr:AGAP010848-PA [Anopheles gambiae str. PEST]
MALFSLPQLATVVALGQALHYGDEGIDVKINVEKNSNSYLTGRLPQGSFEYGLDVVKQKDNHFQHKVKGPDDVTYGCYGFVDPDGKPHLVHYVSDLKGYRIVPPESATKIYISRLERSINNVYQASQEKNVQWKDLFFPPACKQLYTETKVAAPPTTPRPTPPRTPSTTRRPAPTTRRTTPAPPPPAPAEPEFTASSNLCPSVVQAPPADLRAAQPACSSVCGELKDELKDIKAKLKTLLDTLAEKPKGRAGNGGGKFAYFPVMLSDGLPDGVDASSAQFAFPAVPQQCGRQ